MWRRRKLSCAMVSLPWLRVHGHTLFSIQHNSYRVPRSHIRFHIQPVPEASHCPYDTFVPLSIMGSADTLAVPDPDVLAASNDAGATGGGAKMRRVSSTSSTYSDVSSPGDGIPQRPSLSRASSTAYSDDGSGSTTPYRSRSQSSASASVEGIDLLGSTGGALPLSGKP